MMAKIPLILFSTFKASQIIYILRPICLNINGPIMLLPPNQSEDFYEQGSAGVEPGGEERQHRSSRRQHTWSHSSVKIIVIDMIGYFKTSVNVWRTSEPWWIIFWDTDDGTRTRTCPLCVFSFSHCNYNKWVRCVHELHKEMHNEEKQSDKWKSGVLSFITAKRPTEVSFFQLFIQRTVYSIVVL